MELKEKIEKQLDAGFQPNEIYANLLNDGHSKEEIDLEFKPAAAAHKSSSPISGKAILFALLLIIVVVVRVARFQNTQGTASVFAFISIFTGILVLIFWFSRSKR